MIITIIMITSKCITKMTYIAFIIFPACLFLRQDLNEQAGFCPELSNFLPRTWLVLDNCPPSALRGTPSEPTVSRGWVEGPFNHRECHLSNVFESWTRGSGRQAARPLCAPQAWKPAARRGAVAPGAPRGRRAFGCPDWHRAVLAAGEVSSLQGRSRQGAWTEGRRTERDLPASAPRGPIPSVSALASPTRPGP